MLMMMSDQAAEINKFVDRDSDIDASHCMTYTLYSAVACLAGAPEVSAAE